MRMHPQVLTPPVCKRLIICYAKHTDTTLIILTCVASNDIGDYACRVYCC